MTSKLQEIGRFLSRMVMPNISAFITWGIVTTLFNEHGWIPNEALSGLIGPMIIYLLPMLIAYSGGRAIYGTRGGVVGCIGTMGLIAGSEIPMILGAMIFGPLGGYSIKKLDQVIKAKIPTGFEMLTTNFSAGILGTFIILFAYKTAGPMILYMNQVMKAGVDIVLKHDLLFLTSIFIEPGKVLFLNNAINHGILGPFGVQEAISTGKSIFFLLETNPGPGLGILIAYWVYGKGQIKQSAPGAVIIHFLGGIHEIYFPYVLMSPALFIAVILGGMSGVFIFEFMGGGLAATPSPGSIFALLALTPRNSMLAVLSGVSVSAIVSFVVSGFILKRKANWEEEELSDEPVVSVFADYKGNYEVSRIHFACDAGMGSSAMGASLLTKLLIQRGIQMPVINVAIEEVPEDADVVITFSELMRYTKKKAPKALHLGITDFLDKTQYERFLEELIHNCKIMEDKMESKKPTEILMKSNIVLNQASVSKFDAIERAGKLLFESGYVGEDYIQGMRAREEKFSTFIGNGVAIPHGENSVKESIKASGIVVIQYPNGVDFGEGKIAKLVIGIAGKGNEHIQLLANIAEAIEEEELLEKMLSTDDPQYIYEIFSSEGLDA